jgi:hypothetical protein
MAELPQIVSPTPVTVPAVSIPEKTYPDLYLMNLQVTTTPQMDTKAIAHLRPYNYTTKELQPQCRLQQFVIPNIWAEAVRVPLLAQVMGGIISVISGLIQEKDLVAKLAEDPTNETLLGQLAAVRTALGIV